MAFEIANRAQEAFTASSKAYLAAPPKERDYKERNRRQGEDMKNFAADLAAEYAADLPAALQEKVFEKAWDDRHSEGTQGVENAYEEYAEFAIFARTA